MRTAAMLRSAMVAVAALLLTACAAPLPPRPDVPYGQGLLWQIDRPGQAPSYVFGTMHVSDYKVRDVPPEVHEALARADQAAFELVKEDEDDPETKKQLFRAALLPGGLTLETLLDDASYEQFIDIIESRAPDGPYLGKLHVNRFKPWFVMLMIGSGGDGPRGWNPLAVSLDDWLEERARDDDKVIVGLETSAEQLAVFNEMTMDDQVVLLKDRLADYDQGPNYWTWRQLYLDGDTAMFFGLWQATLARLEPGLAARFAERFLDGRNRIMVERMMPLFERAPTFVAVGALHLPGELGVLSRLEREGYTVTRLR